MSVRRSRGRRRAHPSRRQVTHGAMRQRRRESRCGSGRRGFPRAGQARDGDHQADQRRIGSPRRSGCTRAGRARGSRVASPSTIAQHAETSRQDRRARSTDRAPAAARPAPRDARAGAASRRATLSATQRAQTTASSSELLARRLAPCRPVAADLAAGPEARDRAAPVAIHGDAAHVIVRRRPDRDRLASPGRSRPSGRTRRCREALREIARPGASRASRNTRCPAARWRQTARATTSRGASSAPGSSAMKRSPVSSISTAPSPRTASVTQRHRARRPVEARSGGTARTPGRRAPRRRAPPARGPGRSSRRIGGVGEKPADAAGRDHDAAGGEHQRAAVRSRRARPATRVVLDDQPARLDAFEQRDRRRAAHRRDQRAHDLAAGAVAVGMDDAAAAVRGFEAEAPAAVWPPVEARRRAARDRRSPPAPRATIRLRDGLVAEAVAGGDACRPDAGPARRPRRSRPRCRPAPKRSTLPRRAAPWTAAPPARGARCSAVIRPASTAADDDRTAVASIETCRCSYREHPLDRAARAARRWRDRS